MATDAYTRTNVLIPSPANATINIAAWLYLPRAPAAGSPEAATAKRPAVIVMAHGLVSAFVTAGCGGCESVSSLTRKLDAYFYDVKAACCHWDGPWLGECLS